MDKPLFSQVDKEKLIQIVNEFFETSPVPAIELLNKCFFQTDAMADKQELLKISKLILNLYEVMIENEKEFDTDNSEINKT